MKNPISNWESDVSSSTCASKIITENGEPSTCKILKKLDDRINN